MSTRGFIALKTDGRKVGVYNHSDSYPSWLGVRMAELIQTTDLAELATKVATLVAVNEDDQPSAEQSADLKARGFWSNVSTGTDWYSHLRHAQGSLALYIEAGYIPKFDVDATLANNSTWMEWGYIIDVDTQALEIYDSYGGWKKRATLTFEQIRADDFDTTGFMVKLESDD
jgi:hypothetical protein